MRKILLTLAAVLAFTTAHADESHVLSYNYIGANYIDRESDPSRDGVEIDAESDGYELEFSVDLGQSLYIFGSYSDEEINADFETSEVNGSINSFDANRGELGLGYYRALSDAAHWNLAVSALNEDADGADDEWGARAATGFRVALGRNFEVGSAIGYNHYFDDDIDGTLTAGVDASLYLGRVAITAGYEWQDEYDVQSINAGLRIHF